MGNYQVRFRGRGTKTSLVGFFGPYPTLVPAERTTSTPPSPRSSSEHRPSGWPPTWPSYTPAPAS